MRDKKSSAWQDFRVVWGVIGAVAGGGFLPHISHNKKADYYESARANLEARINVLQSELNNLRADNTRIERELEKIEDDLYRPRRRRR